MKKPKRQHIYIYDHPESKIQFLEQSLHGKDWRATLVYPDDTTENQNSLVAAKNAFESRGYIVEPGRNEFNQRTLEIHHLGEGAKPSEIVREMGLAKGVGHLITHPSLPLATTLDMGQKSLTYLAKLAHDPAHMNGLIYLAAEGFLFKPDKGLKITEPRNLLRSLGFGLFLTQSLTYLFVAKNNDDTSFEEFKNKIKKTMKQGGDLTQVRFDPIADKPPEGIGHSVVRLLRHYPIQAGALFNNLGMVSYIISSFYEKKHAQGILALGQAAAGEEAFLKAGTYLASGFKKDIGGALTSILAWTFMLVPPKKKEENQEVASNSNIVARSWNALRENPQIVSGTGTLLSSAQRLAGAHIRENKNQKIGEKIYIGGDIMLLFTKNDHYGSKTGNVDKLSDTLSEYINQMPFLLGAESQHQMVKNMSDFVLNKGLAEIADSPKTATFTAEELKERANLLELEVGRRVRNSYTEQMEQLGDVTARLVGLFPDTQRQSVIDQLATALPNLSWIYAKPEEIKTVLESAVKRSPACQHAAKQPKMADIQQAVADMVGIMWEADMGTSAALIYDALLPQLTIQKAATAQPKMQVTHVQPQGKQVTTAITLPASVLTKNLSTTHVAALETADAHMATQR